jgi:hypothetical protein
LAVVAEDVVDRLTFAGQIIETGTLSNASRRLAAARRARSLTDVRAELLQDTRVQPAQHLRRALRDGRTGHAGGAQPVTVTVSGGGGGGPDAIRSAIG